MSIARSVTEVLADHVSLEVESIDRMYLNLYVPGLQYVGSIGRYLRNHMGSPLAATAMLAPISERFVDWINSFVATEGLDLLRFGKG